MAEVRADGVDGFVTLLGEPRDRGVVQEQKRENERLQQEERVRTTAAAPSVSATTATPQDPQLTERSVFLKKMQSLRLGMAVSSF